MLIHISFYTNKFLPQKIKPLGTITKKKEIKMKKSCNYRVASKNMLNNMMNPNVFL